MGLNSAATSNVPALVLGSGITPLGVVRSLGRAGIPLRVACPPADLVRRSRWFEPLALAPWDGRPGPASAAELEALPFDRAVLIPCSDQAALWVSGLSAATRVRFPSSTSRREVFELLVDKARFADVLERAGTPHPFTLLVGHRDDLRRLDQAKGRVIFLKPVDSQSFFRRFGVKAFHLRDRAEAEARWDETQAAGLDMVLQEYVPGPATSHVFIDGFRDRTGVVRAWFARRRLRMFPPDFGNSTYMVSIPVAEVQQAVDSLDQLLGVLEYRGVFSAEFKWDSRDERFKLLEINPRPWWYVEYAAWCGVDVVRLSYLDALERPVPDVREYRVGRRCVYPYYDLEAWRAQPEAERPSALGLVRSWIGARQPVFQLGDPAPGIRDTVARVRATISKRFRG